MILFPVLLEDRHYALISFNLKYPAIDILDNVASDSTVQDRYGDTPEFLRGLVLHYLDLRRLYRKKKELASNKVKPNMVDIPWGDAENLDTTCIYTMCHMEAYMGASVQGWKDEINAKNCKTCVMNLRVKYLHAILMSDLNELKPNLKENLVAYKQKVPKPMRVLVTGK